MKKEEIYKQIISTFNKEFMKYNWARIVNENGSLYGFFVDYIKDYYTHNNLIDEVCHMLKDYYKVPFYYAECHNK